MSLEQILKKILKQEVHFHFAKSSGHGGQNVNKRMTKAELYFNVQDSKFLTDEQKELILDYAGNMVHHHEKILIMSCQEERYQRANKLKAIHHFRQLMEDALKEKKDRIETKVPKKEKEKRLNNKKHHSNKKELRSKRHHHLEE